jgi:hypothetical protein
MSKKFDIYSKIFYMDVEKFVRHLCRLVLRHQIPVWNYFVNSFYSVESNVCRIFSSHFGGLLIMLTSIRLRCTQSKQCFQRHLDIITVTPICWYNILTIFVTFRKDTLSPWFLSSSMVGYTTFHRKRKGSIEYRVPDFLYNTHFTTGAYTVKKVDGKLRQPDRM